MAEAVAAISLTASIVQLLSFGTEVIARLHDYRTKAKETPAVFHDVSVQLPLLIADLRVTKEREEQHGLPPDVAASALKIVESCETHIRVLDEVLIKTMPDPTDSAWRTGKKVLLSFRQEEKVRNVAEKLRSYVIYLTHHAVTNAFRASGDMRSLSVQNDEQMRMLQWLSNDDPSISHNRAVQKKQQGSGQCRLRKDDSMALQEVLEAEVSSTVAYWYFDFNSSPSLSVSNMLRSLIKQLCIGETILPSTVQDMCAKFRASGHQPNTNTLLTTLLSAIDGIRKKTFLVLDALDEYPESGRRDLLAAVKLLRESEHDDIHVLVTSRSEYDIEHILTPFATQKISIHGLGVDDDIRTHVRASLAEDVRFCRLSPSVKENIETRLVSGARGMFRWVDCQLDTLRACNKVSAIKKSLDQLPATLDETYERILRAIEPADTVEAYNILQWLAFAERPLTLEEVAEAAVTKEDGGPIDPEDRLFDPYDVVRICKGLVSITEDKLAICGRWTAGKFVRFAHFSVKEYLLSSRVLEGTAKTFHMVTKHSHQQIGRSCLSILLQNDEISKLQHLPLVKYAAQFWVKHLCKYESDAENTAAFKPLIEKLFGDSPKAFQNWLFVYDVNIGQGHDAASSQRPSSPPSPLYYAAFLGLEHAIRMLLKSRVDINAYGGRYGTALIAAATQGNSAAVSILLDHDANVDAKGGYTFYTALQASSFFGFTSVVRMLLDGGAQPDRRRAKDDTALELACEAGHGSIVELLIRRGSDVNLHAGGYGYPLSAAAERGHYDVVCLLLEKGARVDHEGGLYATALQAAASAGSEPIVRLLLREGADVNVHGGVFGDALRASSIRGHHKIVEILLDHGASIDHLIELLSASSGAVSNSGSTNVRLAHDLKSAFATRDSIGRLATLVKEAHFFIRAQEIRSRGQQATTTTTAHPNVIRLQKLVKQAVQTNFSQQHGQNPQSRFFNAALSMRNK
ncbi:MAG: hypothetical protein LQ344_006605 [Seirophora lacunosa]|nr:MAG: hypothetical protein LQ344_006605 [Seirophora lacunosa]